MELRSAPAIALGGTAGAAARWWLHDLWPGDATSWATLVVNVAGSALLGWLVAGTDAGRGTAAGRGTFARIAGAGFCGSFTTFSAVGLIVARHFESGRPGAGALYAAGSLAAAIAAAVAAGLLRRRFCRSRSAVTP